MSASGKLKALVAQWHGTGGERLDAQRTMLDALPQVVAVVEAAEITSVWPESEGWTRDEVDNMPPYNELRAALTALEEALGGDVT